MIRAVTDPRSFAAHVLAGLSPEDRAAVLGDVAVTRLDAVEAEPLSDSFIATVVDGAAQKGICMRHVQRIDGPYPHGPKFRLRVVERGGRRRYVSYDTEVEATRAKRALETERQRATAPGIREVLADYQAGLLKRRKGRGVETTMGRLHAFLGPVLEQRLAVLTPERATALLRTFVQRPGVKAGTTVSIDTQKSTLGEVRTFGKWAAREGLLKAGVFVDLVVEGKRRTHGKPQLSADEAVRWWAKAHELAAEGDQGAIACMVAFVLARRSSEVTYRTVRELDGGGTVLWVVDAKTPSGRMRIALPGEVAGYLRELAKGRAADEPLFLEAAGVADRKGWLLRACSRICAAAGVPRVTPHGLRGTGSSLATGALQVDAIARALGHGKETATALRHYVDPEALANSTASRIATALGSN